MKRNGEIALIDAGTDGDSSANEAALAGHSLATYPLSVLPERMHKCIDASQGCWVWTGRIAGKGYARCWNGKRDGWAHRFAYECAKGPIPPGLHIDHLCREKRCVNPAHLEAVTPRENHLRSTSREVTKARHKAKTHCKRGHLLSGDNVVMRNGLRACQECAKMHTAAYKQKNSEKIKAADRERARRRYAASRPNILAEIARLTTPAPIKIGD